MLGALYGDIAGSRFEFTGFNEYDFPMFLSSCHFTDDSLMTLAVAEALVITRSDRSNYKQELIKSMKRIAHEYPNVNWGLRFYNWLFVQQFPTPMNSFGNGSAMRISPVGWVCETLEETIELIETGKNLLKTCYTELDKADGKLTEVREIMGKIEEI